MATNKQALDQLAADESSGITINIKVDLFNRYLVPEQRRAMAHLLHEHSRTLQAALGLVCPNRASIGLLINSSANGKIQLSLLAEVTDDVINNEE